MRIKLVESNSVSNFYDSESHEYQDSVKLLAFEGDLNTAQAVALLNSAGITVDLLPKNQTVGEVMESLRERNKELEEDNMRYRARIQQLESRLNKLMDKALGL
jgi:hypothetical protein